MRSVQGHSRRGEYELEFGAGVFPPFLLMPGKIQSFPVPFPFRLRGEVERDRDEGRGDSLCLRRLGAWGSALRCVKSLFVHVGVSARASVIHMLLPTHATVMVRTCPLCTSMPPSGRIARACLQ